MTFRCHGTEAMTVFGVSIHVVRLCLISTFASCSGDDVESNRMRSSEHSLSARHVASGLSTAQVESATLSGKESELNGLDVPRFPGFDGNYTKFPALAEFHVDASVRNRELLLKIIWYDAPYSGFYDRLVLREDGGASVERYSPNWATQGIRTTQLSQVNLTAIKARIEALSDGAERRYPLKEENRLRYTALVWYKDKTYHRMDFVGALPQSIGELIATVEEDIATVEDRHALEAYREAFRHTPMGATSGQDSRQGSRR